MASMYEVKRERSWPVENHQVIQIVYEYDIGTPLL